MKRFLPLRFGWYVTAALVTALTLVLTQQLDFRYGSGYFLLLLPVMLSARYGGLGPGLFAALLAALVTKFFFFPLLDSFWLETPSDVLAFAVFGLILLVASGFAAAYGKAKRVERLQTARCDFIAMFAARSQAENDPAALLAELAPAVCRLFRADYGAVMELSPDGGELVLNSGCGWQTSVAGQRVSAKDDLFARSLVSQKPLAFDRLVEPTAAPLLRDHQIVSGMIAAIRRDNQPFGVIGIFATQRRRFENGEIAFLQTIADLVGKAIARCDADARLRHKKEGLERTLSSIADGVIAVDSDRVVTFVNPAAQAMLGITEAESNRVSLDDVFRIVDEKTDALVENPASLAIQSGKVVGFENHLLVARGEPISIDAHAAPVHDATGKVSGAVVTFRDTTVRRQIEQAIRQSEKRLRVALKNSPVAVFNQDKDLRYTWVHNPASGFPDQSVVGKSDADLLPASDAARWSEIKRGVIAEGVGTRVQVSATVDRQRRTYDLTAEPLRDEAGAIAGVTCALIDITGRTREQATMARLAAIVESSDDAIIGKTVEGVVLSWNPGAERLFGYEPDEIIGQSIAKLYPPDRMDEFRQVTEQLKRGEPIEQHDTVRVRKDGTPVDVSVSVSLVRDSMGRVIGASSIARDITQRKQLVSENARLVEELRQVNADLEQRVNQRTLQLRRLAAHIQSAREEERTRIAREIHDELGQVLTVVKMDLALIKRNLLEPEPQSTPEEIVTQIGATSQVVDDSIQKMREIIRELRPGILDHLGLKSAIEWQAQEFRSHTGIECSLHSNADDISLDLERSTAVFRIFQETLTNVARHAHATHVDVDLEKNDHLTLQVRDNGKGISAGEISSDKSFGILGMRERALVFGGDVEVQGEPGKGTTVRVRIPLERHHD